MAERWHSLALLLFFGCDSGPVTRELPPDHPASSAAPETAFQVPPDPFAASPTYAVPPAERVASSMPGTGARSVQDLDSEARSTTTEAGGDYTCPMHPDVVAAGPGQCPLCGMVLRLRSQPERRSQ